LVRWLNNFAVPFVFFFSDLGEEVGMLADTFGADGLSAL
jgi:hypothetical protein